jgi:sugar phosphate permease
VFWRGFGAFFVAIIDAFGWSRGATAAAVSIQRLEGGMISPFVGTLIDRFGPRRVLAFGIIVTGLAFVLMSQMQTLWQFYLTVVLLTVGMSFGTFIVFVVTVGNWFRRGRARALAVLMSASAVGGLTLPVLTGAIESFGWREVLFAVGVGFWVVGLPATLVMRRTPEAYGMLPDGDTAESIRARAERAAAAADSRARRSRPPRENAVTAREALKMRFFWQLAVASSLGQFVSASNLTHLDALETYGVSLSTAAFAVGAVAAGDLLGRASIAVAGDRMDKRVLLAVAFGLEAVGILALALVNAEVLGVSMGVATIPVYSVGFGLGFGATVPIRLAVLADYFGRKSYGSIVGLTSSVNALFGGFGAFFAGLMFDLTDSFRIPFTIMAIMLALSVPLSLGLEKQGRVAARARRAGRRRAGVRPGSA